MSDATGRTRLLYLRDTLTICGPGKTILNTWRTLDRARYHITIVATQPNPGARNELLEEARRLGATAHELRIGRGVDPVAVAGLVRLIRSERIDVLQTHDAQTRRLGVIAAALTGVRHISSVHGWIFNDRKERVARWVDRRLLRSSRAVIVVSNRLRAELVDAGVPADRITLLRNAIMLQDYPQAESSAGTAVRRRFQIPDDAPVVSVVGRLSPEKGHDDFLRAAQLVRRAVPTVRFLIVGDGPLRAQLDAQVAALDLGTNVTFTGHLRNPGEVYGATDVLALSSHTEGIPNVLLEAFAYGKPAVATSVGGVPEVLDEGTTGLLVPPRQPDALAEKLVRLLREPSLRAAMGRAARTAVERQFSFLERTRGLEQLYARLLDGSTPTSGLARELL